MGIMSTSYQTGSSVLDQLETSEGRPAHSTVQCGTVVQWRGGKNMEFCLKVLLCKKRIQLHHPGFNILETSQQRRHFDSAPYNWPSSA